MSQVVDFEDDYSEVAGDADLFDCEYSSVDALINEVIVYTGVRPGTVSGPLLLSERELGSQHSLQTARG